MKEKKVFLSLVLFLGALSAVKAAEPDNEKAYTLQKCIEQAVNNLPEISAARYRVKQQKENLNISSKLNLPVLDTQIKYNRLPESTPQKRQYLGESLNDFQSDIVLKQPIYTGGRNTAASRAASHGLKAAENEYKAVVNNAVYKVKISYYKLLYSRYMVASRENILESMRWFYKTALDLNRKTKIPREETLLRIQVQMNQVSQSVISARQNYSSSRKELLAAMGLDTSGSIDVAVIPETLSRENKRQFDTSVKTPEIDTINSRINEAKARIREAESGYYPGVNALLSYGYEWPGLEAGDTRLTAGISLDFSLWNWGRTKAEVRKSKERVKELESNKAAIVKDFELALESARLKYESAADRFEIASKNLDLAKRSLEMFKQRYNDTTATSDELLDSQKEYAETQESYASALFELRSAAAEVEKITGEYFEDK